MSARAASPPSRRIAWRPSWRLVPSRFPPVGLFDRVARPADLETLFALEALTCEHTREALGALRTIPPERRISGPGTTPVMAAFTYRHPHGTRFTTRDFAAYYAAQREATALAESSFHRARFLGDASMPPTEVEMRCYLADIASTFCDVRGGWPALHDPSDYSHSQRFGAALRSAGGEGVVYDSVRHASGTCVAVFYPDRVRNARQGKHYLFRWDGARISTFAAT